MPFLSKEQREIRIAKLQDILTLGNGGQTYTFVPEQRYLKNSDLLLYLSAPDRSQVQAVSDALEMMKSLKSTPKMRMDDQAFEVYLTSLREDIPQVYSLYALHADQDGWGFTIRNLNPGGWVPYGDSSLLARDLSRQLRLIFGTGMTSEFWHYKRNNAGDALITWNHIEAMKLESELRVFHGWKASQPEVREGFKAVTITAYPSSEPTMTYSISVNF